MTITMMTSDSSNDEYGLLGDLARLYALYLMLRLTSSSTSTTTTQGEGGSSTGLSLKTQQVYLLVYATRYSDLVLSTNTAWSGKSVQSIYHLLTKLILLASTAVLVWRLRQSPEARDNSSLWLVVAPAALLGYLWQMYVAAAVTADDPQAKLSSLDLALQTAQAMSMFLESVAILPQLSLLHKHSAVPKAVAQAVLALGVYRFLYVLHWLHDIKMHNSDSSTSLSLSTLVLTHQDGANHHPSTIACHMHCWLAYLSGLAQVLWYADFAVAFYQSHQRNKSQEGAGATMTYESPCLKSFWQGFSNLSDHPALSTPLSWCCSSLCNVGTAATTTASKDVNDNEQDQKQQDEQEWVCAPVLTAIIKYCVMAQQKFGSGSSTTRTSMTSSSSAPSSSQPDVHDKESTEFLLMDDDLKMHEDESDNNFTVGDKKDDDEPEPARQPTIMIV